MAKRQIKVKINKDGTFEVNNAGNSDEQQILKELSELAKSLNGDASGFKIEEHKHTHGSHTHTHTHNQGS